MNTATMDRVAVDYKTPHEFMIDVLRPTMPIVDKEITTANFPLRGVDEAELVPHLVCFGKSMKTSQVSIKLEKAGLRAANLEELLCFLAIVFQGQPIGIAALNAKAKIDGKEKIVYLLAGMIGRLRLMESDQEWPEDFHFLAFEK